MMQGTKAHRHKGTKGNAKAFRSQHQRAFSFAEVLFAVIILGVGFIMIAAVFPVAIRQSKSTVDEMTAAVLARGAAGIVDQMSYYSTSSNMLYLPATGGNVVSLSPATSATTNAAWKAIRNNIICSQDARYAFIPLYRRNGVVATQSTWDSNAQIYVICVQAQASSAFSSLDVAPQPVTAPTQVCNLQPREFMVDVGKGNDGGPSTVLFSQYTGTAPAAVGPTPVPPAGLAEGAFIIIADDGFAAADPRKGIMNGRIYRIGARRPDLDSGVKVGYELAPGYEFTADPGADGILGGAYSADDITALTGASAWVVGQSFSDPQDITKGYEGAAMDVSIYSTFVAVKH